MSEAQRVFDVIASYFINVYWKELYNYAVDAFAQNKFPTREDAFKTTLDRYCNAFTRKPLPHENANGHYEKIVKALHQEFQYWFKMPTLTLGGFIDMVTKQLIPKEFYSQLARQDKNKNMVFQRAMTRALTEFTVQLATDGTQAVLYGRSPEPMAHKHMRAWKIKFIELLFKERDTLYSHFMASKNGVDLSKPNENINKKALEMMQEQIKKLIHEKAKLQKSLESYEVAIDRYRQLTSRLQAKINQLERGGTSAPTITPDPYETAVADPFAGRPAANYTTALGDDSSEGSFESEESSSGGISEVKPPPVTGLPPTVVTATPPVDKDTMESIMKPMKEVGDFSGEDFIEEDDLGSDVSDAALEPDE